MKTMKYLSLLLIMVAMSVCMVSCGDDDDKPANGNSSLVGTWEVSNKVINTRDATLRVEFKSNNKGTMSAIYTDGTDSDSYNFEYVKKDLEGSTYLTIVWTGNYKLIYDSNREYDVTITPTRLVWGNITYTRK